MSNSNLARSPVQQMSSSFSALPSASMLHREFQTPPSLLTPTSASMPAEPPGEGHQLMSDPNASTQYDTMKKHIRMADEQPRVETKKPRRSMSTPARPADVLKGHKSGVANRHHHLHGQTKQQQQQNAPLVHLDPERNVKKVAAHEFAKATFFHGSFTSSHGAMFTRQTPKLGPCSPYASMDNASRARQRAMQLMPPAMRAKYVQAEGGSTPNVRPVRLLVPMKDRSPSAATHQQHPASQSQPPPQQRIDGIPPVHPTARRNMSVESTRSIGLPPLAGGGSFALPPAVSTPRTVSTLSISKGRLSESEEMQQKEDPRNDDEELGELDDELVSWTDALLELLPLALPATISMALTYGLASIPLAFIGSFHGEEKLAGASVGYFLIAIVAQYPICGLTFALDTLVSHEFGRNPTSDVIGVLLQRGILVNLAFCFPVSLLLWNSHGFLEHIYGTATADVARDYLRFAPLFLVPLVFFTAFSKFCSNQMLPQIPMVAMAAGLAVTPVAQKWLISMGVEGAMLGMAISAWFQLVVVIILTFMKKETRQTFGTIRIGEALDWDDVKAYLKLAIPSALFVAAEASAFDMSVLLAARLGDAEGAAWSAILNSCLPFVSIPGGLSTGACAKVGASLGAGYPHDAKRYAFAAVGAAAVCSLVNATVIFTFFDFLLGIFGCDGESLVVGRTLITVVPFMHVADSIQFTFQGVFSGAGQNHKGAMILLSSLWAIGFPLSCFLAFFMNMGVRGVVLGLTIGLLVETPCMIYAVYHLNWTALAEEAQAEAMEDEQDEEEEGEEYEEDDEEEMEEFENNPSSCGSSRIQRGRSPTPKM